MPGTLGVNISSPAFLNMSGGLEGTLGVYISSLPFLNMSGGLESFLRAGVKFLREPG